MDQRLSLVVLVLLRRLVFRAGAADRERDARILRRPLQILGIPFPRRALELERIGSAIEQRAGADRVGGVERGQDHPAIVARRKQDAAELPDIAAHHLRHTIDQRRSREDVLPGALDRIDLSEVNMDILAFAGPLAPEDGGRDRVRGGDGRGRRSDLDMGLPNRVHAGV